MKRTFWEFFDTPFNWLFLGGMNGIGAITAFGDGENAWFVFHAAIGSLCLFYGLRGAYRVRGK